MILRNVNTGQFEVYDIRNNAITSASDLATVGLNFQVAGFGAFHAPATSDMMLRNVSTGEFEVYDIVNNQITTANSLGTVGLDWSVGGFAADPPTGSPAAMGSSIEAGRLVQSMAGFGAGGGDADASGAPLSADASQEPFLTRGMDESGSNSERLWLASDAAQAVQFEPNRPPDRQPLEA